MSSKNVRYRFSAGLSLFMHILLFILLLCSIDIHSGANQTSTMPKVDIVKAAVIDENAVQMEVKRLETIEMEKKAAEQRREQMAAQKLEEAKIARLKEQAKLLELKKEMQKAQKEEESRLAEIKLAKEKERKELEKLQQQKEQEKKKLAAMDEQSQEAQQKASDAPISRKKEENKTQEKASVIQAKTAETAEANAKRLQWLTSEEEKNWALFKEKVNQAWIRAPGLPSGLRCKLDIRLLPDGSVMAVQVLNTSGNLAFDQSALAAVETSAPLPVPQDPALIEKFRHFTFEFNPDENQESTLIH